MLKHGKLSGFLLIAGTLWMFIHAQSLFVAGNNSLVSAFSPVVILLWGILITLNIKEEK